MKKNYLGFMVVVMIAMLFTGCPSSDVVVVPSQPTIPPVQYSTNVQGEILTALSQVTRSDNSCSYPNGGDNNRNLFFSARTFGVLSYSNIYMQENASSAGMTQKTSGKEDNIAPTYCAATGMVAFARKLEGSRYRDIWMTNAAHGGALTQITATSDYEESYPDFSRDGRKIVYQKYVLLDNSEIWIHDLGSKEDMVLGHGRMPSFSPDGRKIIFSKSSDNGGTLNLWIMDVDGNNKSQLTFDNNGSVYYPRFSPDGRKIVFQCYKKDKGDSDLWVLDRDRNSLSQLTINKSFDGEPYWSTDGYIYFTSDRGSRDGHFQIWRFRYGAVASSTTTSATTTETRERSQRYIGAYHTVTDGETITSIARRYGVLPKDIMVWNNLTTMTIKPGMKLKVSAQ